MRAREVFLKRMLNNIKIQLFFFLLIICTCFSAKSYQEKYLNIVLEYLNNINEFSSSFLQIQNNNISEGVLSIKNKRLRIEYTSPNELLFILKENKAMFFNKELQEVQYFNPKNTAGQFLLDLFNKEKFLSDAKVVIGEGHFYVTKKIYLDDMLSSVEIYFEETPFQLRKIQITNETDIISFTIINPNFFPDLNDKIFSLANPLLSL